MDFDIKCFKLKLHNYILSCVSILFISLTSCHEFLPQEQIPNQQDGRKDAKFETSDNSEFSGITERSETTIEAPGNQNGSVQSESSLETFLEQYINKETELSAEVTQIPVELAQPEPETLLPQTHSTVLSLSEMAVESIDITEAEDEIIAPDRLSAEEPNETEQFESLRIVLKPAISDANNSVETFASGSTVEFENGEDIIQLSLPETMTIEQLLDLAAEHLGLNYIFDPGTIDNEFVTIRLHGGLRGEIRLRDIYTLLETVLKFKGLAMVRQGNSIVSIVPIDHALDADPEFLDVTDRDIQAGDTVVTRIFRLQHVDTTSVTNLLNSMKLGIVITPSVQGQLLFVTCYSHRLARIEHLVDMLDQPGSGKECRFRPVKYIAVSSLVTKISTLAKELRGITITTTGSTAVEELSTESEPVRVLSTTIATPEAQIVQPVYLDTDERTNRILMIGTEEQLNLIEKLIEILDVVKADLRVAYTYNITNIKAQQALEKLKQLEVLSEPEDPSANPVLFEKPIVVVLDTTNQLLIKADSELHQTISRFLNYIDVSRQDLRQLEVYKIRNVEAVVVRRKLEEIGFLGENQQSSMRITDPNSPAGPVSLDDTSGQTDVLTQKPQVIVNESANMLLIYATQQQHDQIAAIMDYIDYKTPEKELSYKIYPLKNSSPVYIAGVLERLIQENLDTEDKIEVDSSHDIVIVPDPNTFSLFVYATQEDHMWIDDMTKALDKRRPMVLIDVTLVEITRTDKFEYDLNIVASAQEAVANNIGIDPIQTTTSSALLESGFNLLDNEGNPTGQTKVFYNDRSVQTLLTAIERKNYGRVLDKPKIMVDDGTVGEISTIVETTYLNETIQVPDQGAPITTRSYEKIEAKLQLQITPHITEGNLLRLDVSLSREDFGTRPAEGAPPDKTTSKLNTKVFVPDNNTVILGGLVKLNQSKGGSKIPVLGDLPLVGGLFRSVDTSDVEKKMYVFLKANIVRPDGEFAIEDLQELSDENREAFEQSEEQFQQYENIPGVKAQPMQPEDVLDGYK